MSAGWSKLRASISMRCASGLQAEARAQRRGSWDRALRRRLLGGASKGRRLLLTAKEMLGFEERVAASV